MKDSTIPADGTRVRLNGSMVGTRAGEVAVVRRRSPSGASGLDSGLVWLVTPVHWSHGEAAGFWAGRSEYEVLDEASP